MSLSNFERKLVRSARGDAPSAERRRASRALELLDGGPSRLYRLLRLVARVFFQHEAPPAPLHAPVVGLRSFALYLPVCFALEEVTFRGLVDADVADGRRLQGTLTALLSAWLWGLWHLPTIPAKTSLPGAIVSVTVVHVIVGVPLVLWYRRSGNLLVPAVTHAFIDAVRNALVGAPR